MCRSKMAVNATEPNSIPRRNSRTSTSAITTPRTPPPPPNKSNSRSNNPREFEPSTSSAGYSSGSSYILNSSTATESVISSRTSLSSLRQSLPENPHIYDFSEIRSATNNFLAKRHSSSSSSLSWRCSLRGRDVVIFQRKFRKSIQTSELRDKLSIMCRSHHRSIVKLLGASISGDHIYIVYEFMPGGNLSSCLRNPRNPDFTVLSTWMSRMIVATDLADGLDYIHNNSGQSINLIHKYVKSGSVIVTEPSFNAKICHFGTAELIGETVGEAEEVKSIKKVVTGEITEELPESGTPSPLRRSGIRTMQFEGVRGYMSPEFQSNGLATQNSDVYAFGVVLLELLSGEEPLKYKLDKKTGNFDRTSVIDAARNAVDGGEGLDGRLRQWVDRRLKDSFPVDVAEKAIRVALECVHVDPDKRPNMRRVANKISKLYLDSAKWSERVKVPTEFSVSFAPR
ncbi:hypothetical protein LguiA_012283 [Lonicera macranthoides]